MADDIFKTLGFPKNTDIKSLNRHFVVDWNQVRANVYKFFEDINAHPYDRWKLMFTLVPYHKQGTILLLSSVGKHITVQMPTGHTAFEFQSAQILIDLKSCGYAFVSIRQEGGRTDLQELFACVDQMLQMDSMSNAQATRDAVVKAFRKFIYGDPAQKSVAADELARACDQIFQPYRDHLDVINSVTQNITELSAGIISGASQLQALVSMTQGKNAEQLGRTGADTWLTLYWLTYVQRMDQTLRSLDLSAFDLWQDCWSELQSIFGNIILNGQALSDTFKAFNLDPKDGAALLMTGAPSLVAQFRELFDLTDQAVLIMRQFGGSDEQRAKFENIFSGIDRAITKFPVNSDDPVGAAQLRAEFVVQNSRKP